MTKRREKKTINHFMRTCYLPIHCPMNSNIFAREVVLHKRCFIYEMSQWVNEWIIVLFNDCLTCINCVCVSEWERVWIKWWSNFLIIIIIRITMKRNRRIVYSMIPPSLCITHRSIRSLLFFLICLHFIRGKKAVLENSMANLIWLIIVSFIFRMLFCYLLNFTFIHELIIFHLE